MRVVLTGGGTMGPVMPLLAIVQKLREDHSSKVKTLDLLWLGTRNGPEREFIKNHLIPFKHIFYGKWRRYASFRNFIDPFFIFLGFIQSIFILKKFKPDIILSAGGFVSVPVVWAGWFLKIPSLIHQQDIRPGLANKLMAPLAQKITVTFEKSQDDFSKDKTVWTGNPVREDILEGDKERALDFFNFKNDWPTILILGGGTGALELNKIVNQALFDLIKFCQIIHSAGQGKALPVFNFEPLVAERYRCFDFLKDEIKDAFALADLVITRAGLATLTELSILGKPTIIIPIPDSHQEENARFFSERKGAVVLSQKGLTTQRFVEEIKNILHNKEKLESLKENIKKIIRANAVEHIVEEIYKITHSL